MATVELSGRTLTIHLSTWEKIAGLHGDVAIPVDAIRSAELVDDPLGAARGIRAPGLGVPGWRKLGTWRGRGFKDFVAVERGRPGIRLELVDQPFASVLVSVDDPKDLLSRLGVPVTG
jgi:hypothetical protein